jgi:hypothetical protein
MLFLGLSGENVTRLAAGEPIAISSAQLAGLGLPPGLPGILIVYGKTEQDILEDLAGHGITLYQGE